MRTETAPVLHQCVGLSTELMWFDLRIDPGRDVAGVTSRTGMTGRSRWMRRRAGSPYLTGGRRTGRAGRGAGRGTWKNTCAKSVVPAWRCAARNTGWRGSYSKGRLAWKAFWYVASSMGLKVPSFLGARSRGASRVATAKPAVLSTCSAQPWSTRLRRLCDRSGSIYYILASFLYFGMASSLTLT
ncbi:hypothetical protein J8273_3971 [Carpediemonas membranifera]|uniref:Uncharacterized protein n=1 Tax=Carpediemonas membranifera TaxID=201153 RepID=A0A8J6B7H0_9EUKA|nr:hypothetical protein J8273_3971 [Carpediemonas membranifera]|eukprot:KAG9394337.1 hypothetical protein J8273_3971 [Carpediemonas membranifera]